MIISVFSKRMKPITRSGTIRNSMISLRQNQIILSTVSSIFLVGRSAHGIHFWDKERYVNYRQKCLELFGEDYYKLSNRINGYWHPFGLQRTAGNQS